LGLLFTFVSRRFTSADNLSANLPVHQTSDFYSCKRILFQLIANASNTVHRNSTKSLAIAMNAFFTTILFLFAPYSFLYHPTTFFAGVAIWLVWLYFVNETLFHPHMIKVSTLPAFPSREDFLATKLERLYTLISDDCIICRNQPTTPVKTPCGHIFCKDCFMAWINRGQQTCPLCTRTLFITHSRSFEKAMKLAIAALAVSVPLGMTNLFFGPGGRSYAIYSTLANTFLCVMLLHALSCRHDHGELWWKHVLNPDDRIDADAVEIIGFAAVGWAVHQTMVLERWLPGPGQRLWEFLCVW
jgi:hypothetical protein